MIKDSELLKKCYFCMLPVSKDTNLSEQSLFVYDKKLYAKTAVNFAIEVKQVEKYQPLPIMEGVDTSNEDRDFSYIKVTAYYPITEGKYKTQRGTSFSRMQEVEVYIGK